MIRATATVVLHNFSMFANAAAKGNAVLVTFHSQPWCLIGPVSLLNEPEKKTCRVLNATDAYHQFSTNAQLAHRGNITLVSSRGKLRYGFFPPAFAERLSVKDRVVREFIEG